MIGIKDRFSHSPCQSADCATQAETEGVGPADRAQCEVVDGAVDHRDAFRSEEAKTDGHWMCLRVARAGSRESVEAGTPDRHKHIAHRRFVGPVTGGAWPSESEQRIDQRDPRSRAHTASPLLLVGAAKGMRPFPVRTCGGGTAHLAHARANSFLPRRGGNSRPAHA